MAMLAERRRKVKWSLNPQGNKWSNDSNRFGHRMLEKLGWIPGKGLGPKLQGKAEHVKVSFKDNKCGIGVKDADDHWAQHEVDFNDFLSQLQKHNSASISNDQNAVEADTPANESLELKSKQSRARVHYSKFTRGKDVKKYSSKDLASIFGKRDIEEFNETPQVSKFDNPDSVRFINAGSISKYFESKIPFRTANFTPTVRNESDSEDDPDAPRGFGFSSTDNKSKKKSESNSFETEHTSETEKSSRRKKRKKDADVGCSSSASNEGFVNPALNLGAIEQETRNGMEYEKKSESNSFETEHTSETEKSSRRKKRKKDADVGCSSSASNEGFVNPALNLGAIEQETRNGMEYEVSRIELGTDNRALDLTDENGRKKKVTFNDDVEYEIDSPRKKRKRGKLDKFEVENEKVKKIKEAQETTPECSDVVGFVNEALDVEIIDEAANDNELNELKMRKSRKKRNKKKARINLETIPETVEEHVTINEPEAIGEAILLDESVSQLDIGPENNEDNSERVKENSELKKKKKKKKSKDLEEVETEAKQSKKKKKKKTKKNDSVEEIPEVEDEVPKTEPDTSLPESGKKKKNKKRTKSHEHDVKIDSSLTETAVEDKKQNIDVESNGLDNDLSAQGDLEFQGEASNTVGQVKNERTKFHVKQNGISRSLLKTLFPKAPTLHFAGSNINQIQGYGNNIVNQ